MFKKPLGGHSYKWESGDKHARTKTMEPNKKTLPSPICQAEYSRRDNLLRHLKKFPGENIATRKSKIQILSVRVDGF